MGVAAWRGSPVDMMLSGGLCWPIPITLSADEDLAGGVRVGEAVALVDAGTGSILGILTVSEKYTIDKELECSHVYRTTDTAHPGVQKVMQQGEVNLAGRVTVLSEGPFPDTYTGLYHRPADTRALSPTLA